MKSNIQRNSLFNLRSHRKLIINSVLIVFFVFLLIYFIDNQGAELLQVRDIVFRSKPIWILAGILLSVVYVLVQGLIFQFSFRALSAKVSIISTVILYLKRNLISIFLPGGTFASLAFFTKGIEDQGVSKTKIYFATYVFGVTALLAMAVIALPIMIFLLFKNIAATQILLSFGFLIFFLLGIASIFRSFTKKGFLYNRAAKYLPELKIVLDDLGQQKIKARHWIFTIAVASLIDFIGMIFLYVSLMAIGLAPTLEIVVVGYVVIGLLLIASPFMKGIGVVEFALTFFLTQYGFTTVQAISITALFRLFEFWLPVGYSILSFIYSKNSLILRILPAIVIFLLGLVNIFSSITISVPAQFLEFSLILPLTGEDVSRYFEIIIGLSYVVVATFLFKGSKNAWFLSMVLLGFSFLGLLVGSQNVIKIVGLVIITSFLAFTRNQYYLKSDFSFSWRSIKFYVFGFALSFAYGAIGLFLLQNSHFDVSLTFWHSIKFSLSQLLLMNYSFLSPSTALGLYFVYSLYLLGSVLLVATLFGILKPSISKKQNTKNDIATARNILHQFSKSPVDYFKLYPDKTIFLNENKNGFIAFSSADNHALVYGNPVSDSPESFIETIKNFELYCENNNLINSYYHVSEEAVAVFSSLNKKQLPISEQVYINFEDVSREKLQNRAENLKTEFQYEFQIHPPPITDSLINTFQNISTNHLIDSGTKERIFDTDLFIAALVRDQIIVSLKNVEGKYLGFLTLLINKVTQTACVDIIRWNKQAEEIAEELLLLAAIKYLISKNYYSIIIGNQPIKSELKQTNIYERIIFQAYEVFQKFDFSSNLINSIQYLKPKTRLLYLIYSNTYDLLRVPGVISKVSRYK